jgi:hypothetical protein
MEIQGKSGRRFVRRIAGSTAAPPDPERPPVCLIMTAPALAHSTRLDTRELYAPSHFGNTYEATLPREMEAGLAEAKFWGFNRFSDWFDTIDLYNIYEKRHHLFNMPEAMWARKFANYECAAGQGLGLGLVVTPNHIFSDTAGGVTSSPFTLGIDGSGGFGR